MFSSDLPESGFLIPRTVDATAAIFTEPDDAIPRTSISRQSMYEQRHHGRACDRPIIQLGMKLNNLTRLASPLIEKVEQPMAKIQERLSGIKMRVYDKLNIACLFPRIIRPFEPILKYARCKLGLHEDDFMEAAQCNTMKCQESGEDKEITRDRGPAPMKMMDLNVQTMDDCFGEMRKVEYGVRVLAKIVKDQSCDDPRFHQECQDVMAEGRILEEDQCTSAE